MAQLQAGTAYVDGAQVTAANLNAHVNNAVLVPGAINDQAAAASCTTSDSVLVLQSGALKKATLAQVQTSISPDLTPYLPRSGASPMTGELVLSSATPGGSLSAVPKTYVDTGLATKQNVLGYTPANKAGDTFTGAVVLNADPSVALGAATKQYVDAAVAPKANLSGATFTGSVFLPWNITSPQPALLEAVNKLYVDTFTVPRTGATVSGTYVFNGKLQTPTAPTEANDVVTRGYLEGVFDSITQPVASAYFYTAPVGSSSVNTGTFLSVTATRSSGSTNLVINYGGLAARYYDPAAPFFLTGQYVGLVAVTGVIGGLYKIISSDFNARTFTITQPATTAFSGGVQLSLVYDSTNLAVGQYGFNTKSIYLDMTCVSKYYVNYIRDIISGLSTTAAVSKEVLCSQASGNANGYDTNGLMTWVMRNFGRTSYIYSQDIPEGFGSNSLGCHIGFFYNNGNGSDYSSLYAASFLITAQLPPA
jgi:hypothetical protein